MLFMAAYDYIAAELSQEEVDSVCEIVKANYNRCNSKQIMDLLIAEHPLCLESDLLESFNRAAAHFFGAQASTQPKAPTQLNGVAQFNTPTQFIAPTQFSTPTQFIAPTQFTMPTQHNVSTQFNAPAGYSASPKCTKLGTVQKPLDFDPDDPNFVNNTRWTDEEKRLLLEYLDATKGRKNWIKCAQHVGTRSSAQCKAKHNNMKAQDLSYDTLDI